MLAAILFDLDGTLVNTDPIHYAIWQKMLLKYGLEIDEAFYKSRISGGLNPEILKNILPQLSPLEREKFADDKEAIFRQEASSLQRLPGLTELLAWSEKHQLKRAVVTNAPKENALFMLSALELEGAFDTIILAEEEVTAKPDPAPYKAALKRLSITAEQAIVLEDSPTGIRSAVAAGIRTIGVASTHNRKDLCELGVFMAIDDFTDLQLSTFLTSQLDKERKL
ncbi:MAG: HAD family phosphatase [Scytonematopsis contorta HA4267-MV1]|jgi:beta-phosphoglucomutase|nr:HAD family phosphatase [Scytonematopsis contorta HA4267-MV1]